MNNGEENLITGPIKREPDISNSASSSGEVPVSEEFPVKGDLVIEIFQLLIRRGASLFGAAEFIITASD